MKQDDSRSPLEPMTVDQRPIETSDGLPILGSVAGAVLNDDEVRQLRDDLQR